MEGSALKSAVHSARNCPSSSENSLALPNTFFCRMGASRPYFLSMAGERADIGTGQGVHCEFSSASALVAALMLASGTPPIVSGV